MENEIPVYLFTGFMDSGKTTLLNETLFENHFADDMDNFLVIQCEEGDVEVEEAALSKLGGTYVYLSDKDFNGDSFYKLNDAHHPQAVFIEYNGTWTSKKIFECDAPKEWTIVQTLCTVDATTFDMYMQNMRQMMVEQMLKAEVIIVNRFTTGMSKAKFRANIKAINPSVQIVYERPDRSIDETEEALPFDINADELEIKDMDYALWFMDCMEAPEKYDGKIVSFRALVYNPTNRKGKLKPGTFVPGRFAMTCCVDDIQFLGMKAVYKDAASITHKCWIDIKARIKNEYAKEYKGDGPVLYPISIMPAETPKEELVYFN